MNITIRLTKVEYEMLKELQKKDKRYKKGVEEMVKLGRVPLRGVKAEARFPCAESEQGGMTSCHS